MSHEILKQLDKVKLPKMTVGERLVFSHLCFFARDSDNFAFMSTKLLQNRTGITHRTQLNRILRDLVKMEVILKANKPGNNHRFVEGFVINMPLFAGTPSSTHKNSQFHTVESTVLPSKNSQFQHKKTIGKQLENNTKLLDAKTMTGIDLAKNYSVDGFLQKYVDVKFHKSLVEGANNMLYKKKDMPNPYKKTSGEKLSAKEIVNIKVSQSPPKRRVNASYLFECWKENYNTFYPEKYVASTTTMQTLGLFNNFIKKVTVEHAVECLFYCMKHWIAYVKFCQKQVGGTGTPSVPNLKYLVKYAEQAVSFYLPKLDVGSDDIPYELVDQQPIEELHKKIMQSHTPMTEQEAQTKYNQLLNKKGKK